MTPRISLRMNEKHDYQIPVFGTEDLPNQLQELRSRAKENEILRERISKAELEVKNIRKYLYITKNVIDNFKHLQYHFDNVTTSTLYKNEPQTIKIVDHHKITDHQSPSSPTNRYQRHARSSKASRQFINADASSSPTLKRLRLSPEIENEAAKPQKKSPRLDKKSRNRKSEETSISNDAMPDTPKQKSGDDTKVNNEQHKTDTNGVSIQTKNDEVTTAEPKPRKRNIIENWQSSQIRNKFTPPDTPSTANSLSQTSTTGTYCDHQNSSDGIKSLDTVAIPQNEIKAEIKTQIPAKRASSPEKTPINQDSDRKTISQSTSLTLYKPMLENLRLASKLSSIQPPPNSMVKSDINGVNFKPIENNSHLKRKNVLWQSTANDKIICRQEAVH